MWDFFCLFKLFKKKLGLRVVQSWTTKVIQNHHKTNGRDHVRDHDPDHDPDHAPNVRVLLAVAVQYFPLVKY